MLYFQMKPTMVTEQISEDSELRYFCTAAPGTEPQIMCKNNSDAPFFSRKEREDLQQ